MTSSPTTDPAPARHPVSAAGALRRRVHDPDGISGSQKLMILVLSMTLFGVADIVADMLPSFSVGPLELEVAYFAFIPVVLAALLTPLWVALGVAIGEAVIADLLLGSFGGFGELEGFLQLFIGTYVAGCLVKDPRKVQQLFAAALALVAIDKVSSAVIDVAKVAVGVDPEELEDQGGTLLAVVVAEGFELLMALIITGVVFGGLAAAWLAPRLHGKIEPLMGLRPRDPQNPPRLVGPWGLSFWWVAILGILTAALIGVLSQWEEFVGREEAVTTAGSFDTELTDTYGDNVVWIAALVGLVVGLAVVLALVAVVRRRRDARTDAAARSGSTRQDEDR
ncbi:hypothetical protein BCE75_102199 [Isoptericola sp. CG 20/1183]|uniref:DUF8171 domain-containing protein n=1 Tax=Isoptericola halotolerans TaxID=300560 RepID=A0ABX5EIM5_9MICO|nr:MULTISPECIES: cell division protein FtsQ [Isoptericola]PRZ09486.1 hypothetical protein BCE75_102199 [Isoptericola sp. CG 20/1183]PRZ10287.1 hypothetical protein BCL65_101431 [Isoptericola halotolerans]